MATVREITVKQSIPKELRYTIRDFDTEFPDDDACLEYIRQQRLPDRTLCEKCGKGGKYHRIAGRKVYSCDHCGFQISPLAGTIFEKSSTPLRVWFHAMFQMGSTRCGISAKQIQRETGVTYKTAWRIFKQIRTLLSEDLKLEGAVEMDETYFGGKYRGPEANKFDNKTPIIGMVERKGYVVAKTAKSTGARSIHRLAKEHILPSTLVYTDEAAAYTNMPKLGYQHRRIHHSSLVYVMGDIHTNTIEGFWSLVKRGIGGVYHSVSERYLQTYLNEYCFRYNRRDQGNLLFKAILERVSRRAS